MRASGSTLDFRYPPWPPVPALSQFDLDREVTVQTWDEDEPPFAQVTDPAPTGPAEVSFGSFRLFPTQLLLVEGDKPVPLGSRALGILIALLERPGELISKQELMARVWPNVFVGTTNLTVHISALRRVLRDGRDGNRFIINIPGRGYQFVGPINAVPRPKASLETMRREVSELEEHRQMQVPSDCEARSVLAFRRSRA